MTKFEDTLHRFCKKEHDWGWKKFMELRKIREGFAVNDTLEIKAIVQVIKYISLLGRIGQRWMSKGYS